MIPAVPAGSAAQPVVATCSMVRGRRRPRASARRPSARLFALGALTCPSWWEIVAVPEIAVQVDRLAAKLAREGDVTQDHPLAPEHFLDLGAGI